MRPSLKLTIVVIGMGVLWATGGLAQLGPPNLPPAGFTETGFIQAATLTPRVGTTNPASPRFWGGTITVNGIKMIVPNNSIVQMPAAAFTWADLFSPAVSASVGYTPPRPNHAANVTGLALADNQSSLQGTRPGSGAGIAPGAGPFPSFEVTVAGNIVYDAATGAQKYIVALIVPATQQGLNSASGIINYIDYAAGRFRVGGIMNNPISGTLCEINDPATGTDGDGRFGKQHSPDPRFSADTSNPTMCTSTGYPVGLPRVAPGAGNDPTRPYTQRPLNNGSIFPIDPFLPTTAHMKTFTMNPVGGLGPDPRLQIPLMVGDFVTFSGTLFKINPLGPNTPANTFVSIHTLEVDLGIYTAPGTVPVYVKCDVALIGTDGAPPPPAPLPNGNPADPPINVGNPPVGTLAGEFSRRARFEGFCTDFGGAVNPDLKLKAFGTASVTAYGVQVDAAGNETLVQVPNEDGVTPTNPSGRGNPALVELVPTGRYRFQGSKLNLGPPVQAIPLTREYRVVHSNALSLGVVPNVCNGLIAGQFQLPNFEFVTPERLTLGTPQYPGNYQDLGFLMTGNVAGGTPMGRLDPWPGTFPDGPVPNNPLP